mgnify:FL=1
MRIPSPTYRDFGVMLVASCTTLLAVMSATGKASEVDYIVICLGAILGLGALFWSWAQTPRPMVDIWEYQRALMWASGQVLPHSAYAQVNSSTLLYYGLVLEEMAETAATLCITLNGVSGKEGNDKQRRQRLETALLFTDIHQHLEMWSRQLRRSAMSLDGLVVLLPKSLAVALLDDLSDTAVTLAGMGNTTGLPCAAGYAEVQFSNLSKRNPKTGRIDRDETGKWIKGAAFQKPNLGVVLDQVWEETPTGAARGQPR